MFIFDVALTNCYILSRHHNNSTTKDFRANLAKELIGEFNNRKCRASTRLSLSCTSPLSTDHFPKRSEKRKRCYYCYHYHQRERHESHWYCATCDKSQWKSQMIVFFCTIRKLHNNSVCSYCMYLLHSQKKYKTTLTSCT